MLTAPWKPGPARSSDAAVFVSVTDFAVARWRDVPIVWFAGLRLRRAWPRMTGAVGLWLWADPLKRRSGSVSVWRSEADLQRFVTWPVHVAIMRRFRDRGTLEAASWHADRFVRADVWREARRRLDAGPGAT
jgi:hypothetical protein